MELIINNDYQRNKIDFYIVENNNSFRRYINFEENLVTSTDVPSYEASKTDLKPFLSLPSQLANDFMNLISEYKSQKGFNTENENLLKGKLIATENHLSDMKNITEKLLNKFVNDK
jgi:hypothetical protein